MPTEWYEDHDIDRMAEDISKLDSRMSRIERMLWLLVSHKYQPDGTAPTEWCELYDELEKVVGDG